MMQIVINISEEIYKRALPYKDLPIVSNLANDYPNLTYAVANGTPLPKGHGRLIDANELEELRFKGDSYIWLVDKVLKAPTIIEADKEMQ